MAKVRAACNNCGYVGNYTIPFKARFVSFTADEVSDQGLSYYERPHNTLEAFPSDFPRKIIDCTNCGLPKLESVYWDEAQSANPLRGIHKVTEGEE